MPWLDSVSWLLLPLLLVDCICLLFILLYFAFGIMTGGVNAISAKRVLVVDLNRKRIVREMALDSLREIKIQRGKGDRGSITLYRRGGEASSRQPRRMKLDGIRNFERRRRSAAGIDGSGHQRRSLKWRSASRKTMRFVFSFGGALPGCDIHRVKSQPPMTKSAMRLRMAGRLLPSTMPAKAKINGPMMLANFSMML